MLIILLLTIERVDEVFYESTGVAVRVKKRVFIWREIPNCSKYYLCVKSGILNVRKSDY